MRARKYSIYIKSLKGVSARIRFQGQKSTRKGDTEMTYEELLENYSEARKVDKKRKRNLIRIYRGFMVEIDARVNNETMDRYGIERQSLVAMEELSELQKAISKLVRNPEEKTKPLEFKGLRHNLIEEMADVLICMDQLIEYYQIQGIEIQDTIQAKQERQAKRLDEE
jgi:NTP pyrophosphatase (non-canonical NTP hydrolase)